MNKLIEYLTKNYNPGGNAFRIVLISELLEKSGFTVDEIFDLTMEAHKEKHVLFGSIRVKANR